MTVDGAWITQLRKGCAEYIILLSLREREAYGYEIMQTLAGVSTLALGESTVYPLLGRLTEDGYLSVRTVKSESGPPRRYYRLTQAGRGRLLQMEAYWEKLTASIERARNGVYDEA